MSHNRKKYKTSVSLFLSFLLHTHKPWPWRSNRWWVKPSRYCLASWRMGKIKRGKQTSVWISLKSLWHIIKHLSPVPLESITVINFSQAYKEHTVYTCYCVIVIVQIVVTMNNITRKDALTSSFVLLPVSFFSTLQPEKENRFFLFCIYVFSKAILSPMVEKIRYLCLSVHELSVDGWVWTLWIF